MINKFRKFALIKVLKTKNTIEMIVAIKKIFSIIFLSTKEYKIRKDNLLFYFTHIRGTRRFPFNPSGYFLKINITPTEKKNDTNFL